VGAHGDPSPVVTVRDLTVRYPGGVDDALAGVSFDIQPGELVGVLGRNGAGKSTLCRCLDGIVPQLVHASVSGSVHVAGTDVATTPVRRLAHLVGVALDTPAAQLSQATVAEEIALGLEAMAMPYPEMVVRVREVLDRLGLLGLERRSPASLSGGQQQRVLLAALLAMRPRVLVLDESTAGLDPVARDSLYSLLRDLATAHAMAILVVDQDVERLAEHADRLLLLDGGRLVGQGTPAAVLSDVAAMERAAVRVPDVTAVAAALVRQGTSHLPVTFAEGLAWLARRT